MENKKELKLGYKIALIICLVLVLANSVVEVIVMTDVNLNIAFPIIGLLSLLAALYYAFFGYKKPHGNLLKNVFFVHALLSAAFIVFVSKTFPQYIIAINLFRVVLIAFMAGRLNKFKQNIVIIAIVGMCSFIYGVCYLTIRDMSVITLFKGFSPFISWATLSITYLSRYEAHTEAGLADK